MQQTGQEPVHREWKSELPQMLDLADRPRLGPYILTRELGTTSAFGGGGARGGAGEPREQGGVGNGLRVQAWVGQQPARYLALHEDRHSSHVAYRFAAVRAKSEARRFEQAVEGASAFAHPHALRIEQFGIDSGGHPWVVTPFTGDVDGLRTLGRLLREKSGQMSPLETERAVTHILSTVAAAHSGRDGESGEEGAGGARAVCCHGAIAMDEVLIDRHGSVLIELYGLARALVNPGRPSNESLRDEVRSVVEIGYQLITGLRAEEPLIPAARLVPRLDPRWDAWLRRGLDATRGFDTAQQALEAMPMHSRSEDQSRGRINVRGVFDRLRTARQA